MGKAYKNFWSLNVDEAVVMGFLRYNTPKNVEVLMPANAQMKDIDLVLLDIKKKKVITIQVKGSRAYEPSPNNIKKFGDGSAGWFFFPKNIVEKSKADYFIFLVYVIEDKTKRGRRTIKPHTITIPTKKLKELCKKNKKTHGNSMYSFSFWVDPKKKRAFDFRDKIYNVSKYLDNEGFRRLNKDFGH